MLVFEDDSGRCDGYNNLAPKADTVGWSDLPFLDWKQLVTTAMFYVRCVEGDIEGSDDWVYCVTTAAALAFPYLKLASQTINDDFVGIVGLKDCFPTASGPFQVPLYNENGVDAGAYLKLDNDLSARQLCPLVAFPEGPEDILDCEGGLQPPANYFGNVTGGDENQPISYEWYEDDVLRGTASTHTLYNTASGFTYELKLQATRGAKTAADSIYVTISEPNDPEECEWS